MQSYIIMLHTDADDRYITESAMAEIGDTIPVEFINRVDEIKTIIASQGEPVVILLNVNSGLYKGYGIIQEIRAICDHIPVVVLGEVSGDDHIKEWYRAGANTFIVKPSTVAATQKKIKTFFEYWLDVAEV